LYDLDEPDFDRGIFRPNTPINIINKDLYKYKNKFTIAHINARSLNKNIEELREIIYKTSFDAVAISETWLTKNSPHDRFELNNFTIFRNDRVNKRGGGVLWYIRDHYKAKVIKTFSSAAIPEMLWVEVSTAGKKLALGCLYRPPKLPYGVFANLYDSLISIYAKYEHTILVGDFNCNMLDLNSYNTKLLIDSFMEPFSLQQLIDKPTRVTETSRTLIDLIFVNKPQNALFSSCCDAPGVSDHFFTYVAYSLKKEKFKPYKVVKRDFKNINHEGFRNAIEFGPWENVFAVESVNDKVSVLENYMNDILDQYAPYKSFTVKKRNHTPWIGPNIREMMDTRDSFKNDFNTTGEQGKLDLFKYYRNKVTSARRLAQRKMFNDTINNSAGDSKNFYDAARKLGVMTEQNVNTHIHFSAEKLNNAFVSNNNAEVDSDLIDEQIRQLYIKNPPCLHTFNFQPVSEDDVTKILKSINTNSTGADHLNAFTLKFFIDRISVVLTHIINISFETGIFPDKWKLALIKPIPKINFPLKETDFRPISLLCTLSKIIGRLANRQINAYLIKHSLLDPNQSAYKQHHGCTTALLKITDDILDSIDESEVSILTLLDFSKAFDTVNHRLLLEKLKILGFSQIARDWVESYLTDRYQQVVVKDDCSPWAKIKNGVPQGSILGPTLFNILVSDMRQIIVFNSHHGYADDVQLHKSTTVENLNNSITEINQDLSSISKFCRNSALTINEKKCHYIIIGSKPALKKINDLVLNDMVINNKIIKREKYVRNLGLNYDEVLSWRRHINLLVGRAISKFKDLNKFKKFLNEESKKLLCDSLILSQFSFGDIVFMNMDIYLQKKVQKIQNLCLKFIYNIKKRQHWNSSELRKNINWLSMRDRRILNGLSLLFKTLDGKAPDYICDMFTLVSEISERDTRTYPRNIWIPNVHYSAIHLKSFKLFISKIWNALPVDIKNSKSVFAFKKRVKTALLNEEITIS
jgi:hypothetical protein